MLREAHNNEGILALAEQRFLEKTPMGLAMNEKITCIAFPDLKGTTDLDRGFMDSSPRFCVHTGTKCLVGAS